MWIVTAVSVAATIMNIKKMQCCFTIWLFTNAAWCVYDYYIGAYAQSALFFVYVLLAVWGIYEWRTKPPM
jgi:nicotinamide riboside transporter PnuC